MADSLSTNVQSRSETLADRARRHFWRLSLKEQLALGNSLILLALALAVPLFIARSVETVSERFFLRGLERDASLVASVVQRREGQWRLTGEPGLIGRFLSADGKAGFAVINAQGQIVAGSPGHEAVVGGLRQGMTADGSGQSDALAYAMRRVDAGQDHADILVYQDRRSNRAMWRPVTEDMTTRLGMFLAGALLLSFLAGFFILLLASRGVRRIAREVAGIDPDHMDRRLTSGEGLSADFHELVATLNAAFDRVEEGYRFQGRFADTVAHELRTPISVLRLKCEALPPSTQRDMLIVSIDRLNHLLGQLRALATLEGASPELRTVDMVETTREMVSDLAYHALISGHSLEFVAPEEVVPGRVDTQYLATILSNLVGNATSHTPVGTHIIVGVEKGGVVYVADNGPGMRLDPVLPASRARYLSTAGHATGGSGLGLRIIARSIYLMGGDFRIRTGGPGCEVRIFVPTA